MICSQLNYSSSQLLKSAAQTLLSIFLAAYSSSLSLIPHVSQSLIKDGQPLPIHMFFPP
jgi:hypothetical protein